jgi:hypothetical protein
MDDSPHRNNQHIFSQAGPNTHRDTILSGPKQSACSDPCVLQVSLAGVVKRVALETTLQQMQAAICCAFKLPPGTLMSMSYSDAEDTLAMKPSPHNTHRLHQIGARAPGSTQLM